MTRFLTIDDALQVLDRLGFRARDIGLLASALARPATSAGGADAYPDLDTKAAALLESVVRNHPLLDGNKRTGWTLLVGFLWINGFRLEVSIDDAFALVVGVANGEVGIESAASTIAQHRVAR